MSIIIQEHDTTPPPGFGTGLIERDYNLNPEGCYAVAEPFPRNLIIPESEWEPRLKAQKDAGARFVDISMGLRVLNQGQEGFCWAYSTTRAVQLLRFRQNQDVQVRLSGHAVGCMVKGFRNQGGWNTQSLNFISERGVPSVERWPERSMSRNNDNAATWEDAANYKIVEWWDGPGDADTRRAVFITALLLGFPVPADYNHWGHSVCVHSIESLRPLVVVLDNSWGETWGTQGRGKLEGARALPNVMCVPRVVPAV